MLTVSFPSTDRATHYVLTANGDVVNFGPSDYTRCDLTVNGTEVAAVSTIVGSPSGTGTNGPAAYVSPVAITGAATIPAAGGRATMQCWHDASNGSTPYVDTGASLWAHRTSSLKVATE